MSDIIEEEAFGAETAKGLHKWEKVNLVTRPDGTDLLRCGHCQEEYVRRGLESPSEEGCSGVPVPERNKRAAKVVNETWFCVHCQKPTPKRLTILHGRARVCREAECVRVAVLEDRYSEQYKRPVVEHRHTKACGRCGK